MPTLLEDPTSPVVYRASGDVPYPSLDNPQIPSSIFPKTVTLRDRATLATLIPFFSPADVPPRLLAYLSDVLNKEIETGDTYPMIEPLPLKTFGPYWFGNFGTVMILGDIGGIEDVTEMERNGADWTKICLGSFYTKPNYPGRSSHVCNGGFLVTPAARNKGVGKSMGQCYLEWAPQLGYTYSVFNLVYETNTASCRIWDSLGFKRIGRVPGCGNLRSFDEPVDAIIYGRDLKAPDDKLANDERFDKIRYYLRHSEYPQGANRSEKSRLRSAALHYKLIGGIDGQPERLMLKDKEVISDPQVQYQIAKENHIKSHAGINKTTASIATKYHWTRIKDTVSHVIKNCPDCQDANKGPLIRGENTKETQIDTYDASDPIEHDQSSTEEQLAQMTLDPARLDGYSHAAHLMATSVDNHLQHADPTMSEYDEMAIDPQIIEQIQAQLASEFPEHHDTYATADLSGFGDHQHLHHDPELSLADQHNDQFMDDQTAELLQHEQQLNGHPQRRRLHMTQSMMQNNFVHDAGGGYQP